MRFVVAGSAVLGVGAIAFGCAAFGTAEATPSNNNGGIDATTSDVVVANESGPEPAFHCSRRRNFKARGATSSRTSPEAPMCAVST